MFTLVFVFFLMMPPPPRSTLFPYTTLFRSRTETKMGQRDGGPIWLPRACARLFPRGCGLTQRSEEHTSELQSHSDLVCRLLLEKKKNDLTLQLAEISEAHAAGMLDRAMHAT